MKYEEALQRVKDLAERMHDSAAALNGGHAKMALAREADANALDVLLDEKEVGGSKGNDMSSVRSMRSRIQAAAEGYGELAALRSGREFINPEFTVEDALEWCMFYLWALENMEDEDAS